MFQIVKGAASLKGRDEMIPETAAVAQPAAETAAMPTSTYDLDWERGRIQGHADGAEAMKQAIYLVLNTERYQYPVYSWNYGVELLELFGRPVSYVLPELKRRISEALLQDDRIRAVDQFSFETQGGKVRVTFVAHTVFGEMELEKEVDIHV